MDKPSKLKQRILALLPKASGPVINFKIKTPPISPRTAGKGSMFQVVSLVPKEARRKSKNGSFDTREEPGSPQVSCTGHLKTNIHRESKHTKPAPQAIIPTNLPNGDAKLKTLLKFKHSRGRKSGDKQESPKDEAVYAPSLGQTKRYTGGRGMLSDFDGKKFHKETALPIPTCLNNPLYQDREERTLAERWLVEQRKPKHC